MADDLLKAQVEAYCNCTRELNASYEEYARSIGLSYTSLQVLSIITANQGTCTQKMLCQQTFLPKQTINSIITGYLKQGYIRMKEAEPDRRTKVILLTAAGKRYADKIVPKIRHAEYMGMEQLSEEERQTLLDSTQRYVSRCMELLLGKEDEA